MSIDQRAQVAAATVLDDADAIDVPDPVGVVRRVRLRRRVASAATAVVLVVLREDGDHRASVDQDALSHVRSLPYARGWC